MNKKEQWIDEVMNSLATADRVNAPAGLKERILQSVKNRPARRSITPGISWSVAAGFLLLVSINWYSVQRFSKTREQSRMMETNRNFAKEYFKSVSY